MSDTPDTELVERLRNPERSFAQDEAYVSLGVLCRQAADRIERLAAEGVKMGETLERAEAELRRRAHEYAEDAQHSEFADHRAEAAIRCSEAGICANIIAADLRDARQALSPEGASE